MTYNQKCLLLVLAQYGLTVRLVPNSEHVEVQHRGQYYLCAWDMLTLRPKLVHVQDQARRVIVEVV